MKLHILKIEYEYYKEVQLHRKTFELRKNDRDYQVGDLIHFVNTNGKEFESGDHSVFRIVYILEDVPEYGLDKDYCILAIKHIM